MSSKLFISWTRENGRTHDLAKELGVDAKFIYRKSRFGLLGRYLAQYRSTRELLKREKPESVILMLPPFPALLAVHRNTPATTKLVFDLHTGFFYDPKWQWACKMALKIIARRGTAVVTNEHLKQECAESGASAIVLHDILKADGEVREAERYLLCPVSYANDEPIQEILRAASLTPDVEWKLTGRAPQEVVEAAPGNVTFTGFVSDEEFDALLRSSGGVVALTTRPHTMQRAGYEAFNVGTAQITSDFPELREFYGDSAIYAQADATSIAEAAHRLFEERTGLVRKALSQRENRIEEQREALRQLSLLI